MSDPESAIPDATIEAVARSLYKETHQYGFRQADYLRLINHLLDMSMQNAHKDAPPEKPAAVCPSPASVRLPLEGDGLRIREFDPVKDRAVFHAWVADKHGRHFLLSSNTAKTLKPDEVIDSEQNILGVITLPDATPIGMMAFLDHDRNQHKAELRKLIGETHYRGKGLARAATQLWISYGISGLGLEKIYLNTLDTNFRNIRLNERLGFRVEGILRKECHFDGEYHDILRMALLREWVQADRENRP
jgi:RimJ/RimL family protein N-acetyltransferase